MPPNLALFICIAFIALLLQIERKRYSKGSAAPWIPTLWLLSSARPVSNWFDLTPQGSADMNVESGNPIDRAVLSVLIVLGLLVLARRRMNWSQIVRDNRWLFVLFLYMLVSVAWSDYPFVSLKRYIKNTGTVIMALVLLSEAEPSEAMRSVFVRVAYILIPLSAVLVRYFPLLGRSYGRWSGIEMWQGATMTKNTLGALCVVSGAFLIWALVRRWKSGSQTASKYETPADLMVLGLTLWLLIGAKSATSLAVLLLGLTLFLGVRRLQPPVRYLGVTLLGGAALTGLLFLVIGASPMALVASLLGRDPTLTGRTDDIWAPLFGLAMENPVLGVGYGGFWVTMPKVLDPTFPINEAHNGYLDVFIQLGAVGILLLVPIWVSFLKKAQQEFEYDRDWASFRIAMFIVVLLHNMTETSWLSDTMLMWNLFLCLAIVYPMRGTQESASGFENWSNMMKPVPSPSRAEA